MGHVTIYYKKDSLPAAIKVESKEKDLIFVVNGVKIEVPKDSLQKVLNFFKACEVD